MPVVVKVVVVDAEISPTCNDSGETLAGDTNFMPQLPEPMSPYLAQKGSEDVQILISDELSERADIVS